MEIAFSYGDTTLNVDAWGVTLSGYAPIKDRRGKAVAILCLDMDASRMHAYQNAVRPFIFLLWSLAAAAVIVVVVNMILRKGTGPESPRKL